nr:zinc finger, CCHC-type [Tanacetum cinerariifolium]
MVVKVKNVAKNFLFKGLFLNLIDTKHVLLFDQQGIFSWKVSIIAVLRHVVETVKVLEVGLLKLQGCRVLSIYLGTGSVQVLQGVEFEVKPHEDHTFEVEPHGNIDHVVGSQKTLLEEHSILSLKGSLSGDCDVEKYGKWSCIYAVGSQGYQMVCTRLDIESKDVGMLDKFDHGSQTDVHLWIFDYVMGRSITIMAAYLTLTKAAKDTIWLKGLTIESRFELKIVAGISIGALSKAIPGS